MIHESRYYQSDAVIASRKALERGVGTQMIVAATGSGKSKIGVDISQEFNKTLWLSHNIELIEQNSINFLSEQLKYGKDYIEYNLNLRGGLIKLQKSEYKPSDVFGSEIKDSLGIIKEELLITDKRITVASVQTLWRRLDKIPADTFDLIVVDECHHAGSTTWTMVLEHFKPKLRLGLTATPWRAADDFTLDELFEETVYEYPIIQGIRDQVLCKPTAIKVKSSANLDKVHTTGSDFNQKELAEKVNTPERNYQIVNAYIKHASGMPFIAFCCNVQHTIDLCEAFNEKGVKACYVVGDKDLTPERKKVIDQFKAQNFIDDEAEGLINCMIATEGFDYPNIGCVILAAPTKSRTKFWQMIGRGLRKKLENFFKKFGQKCIILDIVDNTSKHKVITCDGEDADLPLEDKIFMSEENRQKIRDAIAKREAMMTVVDRAEDEVFELFPLPKTKMNTSSRLKEKAPEMLLARITKLGYDTVTIEYTRQMCTQILLNQPASDADVERLNILGYNTANGVTIAEALLILKK